LAARNVDGETQSLTGLRYPGDVPIVARLRAGEVVDFGPGQRGPDAAFRRAFAAPMDQP